VSGEGRALSEARFVEVFNAYFAVEVNDPSTSLVTLGFDSIQRLELVLALEEWAQTPVAPGFDASLATVRDVYNFYASMGPAPS
jgi:acyl carrier protein